MDSVVGRGRKVVPVVALVAIHGVVILYQGVIAALSPSDDLPTVVLQAVFAAVLFFLAYSLWASEAWAWLTLFIVEGINAIFSGLTLVFVPGAVTAWITAAVAVAILAFLAQPDLRAQFGRPRSSRVTKG